MLKEFDLDAPALSKEARKAFRSQTRRVSALYQRLFRPFRINEKAWKALVEVVPEVTKPHVRDLLGVLTLQIEGDTSEFLNADEGRKPHIALELLSRGVQKLATELRWPPKAFEDAAKAVLEQKFINKWTWKQQLWNKGRSLSCKIEIEHGVEAAKIIASFNGAHQQHLGSVELCSASPSEFAFVPLLGKARWIDDRIVELTSKDGKERWQAVVPDLPSSTPRC
jgi:hypothetical protein